MGILSKVKSGVSELFGSGSSSRSSSTSNSGSGSPQPEHFPVSKSSKQDKKLLKGLGKVLGGGSRHRNRPIVGSGITAPSSSHGANSKTLLPIVLGILGVIGIAFLGSYIGFRLRRKMRKNQGLENDSRSVGNDEEIANINDHSALQIQVAGVTSTENLNDGYYQEKTSGIVNPSSDTSASWNQSENTLAPEYRTPSPATLTSGENWFPAMSGDEATENELGNAEEIAKPEAVHTK
ncbi:hypothetical protein ABW20_dc0107943 [Dactylellina cionopaga]|nr:hypothetical protein ABW20_dc0107943 [Dactylellina cionopaga]